MDVDVCVSYVRDYGTICEVQIVKVIGLVFWNVEVEIGIMLTFFLDNICCFCCCMIA